jgi:hypothetical protein
MEIMDNIIVRITDWSEYESSKSSNGGSYSFTETYTPVGISFIEKEYQIMYQVKFTTSADFQYCENTGSFGNREKLPTLITLDRLLKRIENYMDDENFTVEFSEIDNEGVEKNVTLSRFIQ